MTTPFTATDNPETLQQPGPSISQSNANLQATDENAKYETSSDLPYTDYIIKNEYEYDKHIYTAGVTAPEGFSGNSTSFFQLATPTLIWICRWTACKFGVAPDYPDPTPNSNTWVLLDQIPGTSELALSDDGVTALYRLSGIYVYGNTNPNANPFNQMSFPRPPWMKDEFTRTVPSENKKKNLIDTNQQGGNGGVLNFPVA